MESCECTCTALCSAMHDVNMEDACSWFVSPTAEDYVNALNCSNAISSHTNYNSFPHCFDTIESCESTPTALCSAMYNLNIEDARSGLVLETIEHYVNAMNRKLKELLDAEKEKLKAINAILATYETNLEANTARAMAVNADIGNPIAAESVPLGLVRERSMRQASITWLENLTAEKRRWSTTGIKK